MYLTPHARAAALVAAYLCLAGPTLRAQSPALRWRYMPEDSAKAAIAPLDAGNDRFVTDSAHPQLCLTQRGRELVVRGHFTMPSLTEQLHGWLTERGDTVMLGLVSLQVSDLQPRAEYEAVFEATVGPLPPGSHRLEVYWVEDQRNPRLLASGTAKLQ